MKYECPQCWYPSGTRGTCPHCAIPLVPESELPTKQERATICGQSRADTRPAPVFPHSDYPMPMIQSDEIHGAARMDWAAGREFTSKRDRKDYYTAAGLKRVTVSEAQGLGVTGDHPNPKKSHSIPGVSKTHRRRKWHEQIR